MTLTFDHLRAANIARQKLWDVGTEKISLAYRGNELAGEVGEACNVLKKLERERLGIVGSRDTVEHAGEELADVVVCADLIAESLGLSLADIVAKKFNATSEKNGFPTRLGADVPFKLNEWIDAEVARHEFGRSPMFAEDGVVYAPIAAEIARGAAIHVMMDTETLVGNLRASGWTVTPPTAAY